MTNLPPSAADHYRRVQALQLAAVLVGRREWDRLDGRAVGRSWAGRAASLLPAISSIQQRAAFEGATSSAMTIAQQGTYVPPVEFADPAAFAEIASDGRPLGTLLTVPGTVAGSMLQRGATVPDALASGRAVLDRILGTQVADVARQAAAVDIAARPGVGYVRMVSAGACSRCVVIAGRFFRWNAGFLRHPNCNCEHVATTATSQAEAYTKGLIDDPYAAFEGMSEAEQDRVFGAANAQAIRDGADISQVVNARRGMTPNGTFTSEGRARGYAGQMLKPGQRRLTPEGIYESAERFGHDREWALERLREHGYLLPAGQVPGGSLRGWNYEGFGQMGRGGTRRAASEAVLDARRTGVRDPNSRYTQTAAERRLHDARRRYETALSGRSPYTSPGFGNRPDPYGLGVNTGGASFRPVTPVELARAERDYRALLASNGQIFTK